MDDQTVFRSIAGQIPEEDEKRILEEYSAAPGEIAGLYDEIHTIMDISELEEIGRKMDNYRRTRTLRRITAVFMKATGIAASIVLAAFIAREGTLRSLSGMTATVEAPKGEIIHFTLPDSTVVYLNSGARIQYPAVFRKDCRKVALSGEAMFDVKHDEKCPFVVSTFASEIKVLGTKFNVSADEEDGTFVASLLEGKVLLTNLLDERKTQVEMRPNDVVRISGGKLELTMAQELDICWTRGLVKIGGQDFRELMEDFENAFDVRIVIQKEEIPDLSGVSGKIRINDGIDNALKILQHTASFDFIRDEQSNVVTIY